MIIEALTHLLTPATDFKLADLAVGSSTVTQPILYHFTADRD
jgi:hypothetical protein